MNKTYWDKFDLLQKNPGNPAMTGNNGALLTVEYFFALTEKEKKSWLPGIKKALKALELKSTYGCVTTRFPNCSFADSPENMIALVIFSELFDDSRLSKKLYKHGQLTFPQKIDSDHDAEKNLRKYPIAWVFSGFKKPNRFYNVKENEWSYESWLVKRPDFLILLELSAIDRISYFKYILFYLMLFFPLVRIDFDKIKVYYLIWQWLKKRNKFLKLSYALWQTILNIRVKSGIKGIYNSVYGPNHPITITFNQETI